MSKPHNPKVEMTFAHFTSTAIAKNIFSDIVYE